MGSQKENPSELLNKKYEPDTYYNSLDFMYKYVKEVLIKEITGNYKSFFAKIYTDIESHRYARNQANDNGYLLNNIYPMLFIGINQDFSGPGHRTRMFTSGLFNVMDDIYAKKVIYQEPRIEIRVNSNIFKYQITLNAKFDSSMEASTFISNIYNSLHINKFYYPDYSDLRYRLDNEIYMAIRKAHQAEYENDLDFLDYLNTRSTHKIIREYDQATGNISYFYLFPIRPLVLVQTPSIAHNNANGTRETVASIPLEIEIELPTVLYFQAPVYLVRDVDVNVSVVNKTLTDEFNVRVDKEEKSVIIYDEKKLEPVKNHVVTMPKVNDKVIKEKTKKTVKYETTISIDDLTDVISISDEMINRYMKLNEEGKEQKFILKIYDEDGIELLPLRIDILDTGIDIFIDGTVQETIVLIKIYG